MSRSRAVLLSCLVSTVVLAQPSEPRSADAAAPGGVAEAAPLAAVGPGTLLARGALDADVLLASVGLGVAVDVGMVPMGPGTIAVGGGLDYGFCGTYCLAASATSEASIRRRYFTPHARLTYHFNLRHDPGLQRLDLYGLLMAGMTWASMTITADDTSAFLDAHSLALMGGLGMGANYFLDDRFFFGAEARLRTAQGDYGALGTVGSYGAKDADRLWSLSGVNVVLFAGVRL